MTARCACSFSVALLAALASPLSSLRAADDLDQREQKAFRAAVDRVAPSVLRIETVGGLERMGQLLFGTGPTTGLAVSPDGFIVSSAFNFLHKPASILVQLPDGARKPARLVATDRNRMIALLKVETDKPLPVPEAAPEAEFRVGQWSIGVGRAFEGNQPNMAVGVVSALGRIWGKAIQTDAAVSPNNYGGPLVDLRGRVMGILVPMSPQETSEVAGYEWYDSGIGFAVPFQKVQELLPRLKEGKDLLPGVIGINFANPALFMAEPVVSGCRPKSPAHQAGMKAGDRIVEIEGQKIELAAQVKREIARRYAGDKMKFAWTRDGKRTEGAIDLVAKLEPFQHPFLGVLPMRPPREKEAAPAKPVPKPEAKPEAKPAGKPAEKPDPKTAEAAEPKPAEKAAPKPEAKPQPKPAGVTVRWTYPDSPAAKAGLKRGDVLVALGSEAIRDTAHLRTRLANHPPEESVTLDVVRGGKPEKLEVKLAALPEAAPPHDVPPARDVAAPGKGEKPALGTVQLKVGEFTNQAWAYVPEGYETTVPHGLVLWLHGAAGLKEKELIAQWKPLCDRHDLILLLPKATEPSRWQTSEVGFLRAAVGQVGTTYNIDPLRVVVAGQESGGTMAFRLAGLRNLVRGVAAVDAALLGQAPENEPAFPLAVFIARAERARSPGAIRDSVRRLQEAKHPVTVKELGKDPRPLNAEELSELARWIDALDRI